MEINYLDIGKRIRQQRKKQGLSQEQLAERAGLSIPHMSHIETANTKLSLPALVSVANALGVSVDTLLCDTTVNAKPIYINEIAEILAQSSEAQIRIITDVVKTLKQSLDKHITDK